MANRRMVHKNISISVQVNSLSESAKLLFTWIIPHLDDFGRISGDPKVIKALVIPMSSQTTEEVESGLKEMEENGLIKRYEVTNQKVIQYPTFDKYQTGLKKRTNSKFPDSSGNFSEDEEISPSTELNLSEAKIDLAKTLTGFMPSNNDEEAIYEVWKELSPDNPKSLPILLRLVAKGLTADEIEELYDEQANYYRLTNPLGLFISRAKEKLGIEEL